jgi:hypothetical protein
MFTCEPPHTCHRCNATRTDFLSKVKFPSEYTTQRRRAVEQTAAGEGLRKYGAVNQIMEWNGIRSLSDPGPGPALPRIQNINRGGDGAKNKSWQWF